MKEACTSLMKNTHLLKYRKDFLKTNIAFKCKKWEKHSKKTGLTNTESAKNTEQWMSWKIIFEAQ